MVHALIIILPEAVVKWTSVIATYHVWKFEVNHLPNSFTISSLSHEVEHIVNLREELNVFQVRIEQLSILRRYLIFKDAFN